MTETKENTVTETTAPEPDETTSEPEPKAPAKRTRGKAKPKTEKASIEVSGDEDRDFVGQSFVVHREASRKVITIASINWVGPAPLLFHEDRVEELRDLLSAVLDA